MPYQPRYFPFKPQQRYWYVALQDDISTADLGCQELLVTASLAQVVLDVLRREALFGPDGIPLGLIASHLRFSGLSYLWSPEFWSGLRGFPSHRKRFFWMCLVLCCGLLALMVGPASALLLVPAMRDNWHAGQAAFYLANNDSMLWPKTLDGTLVDPRCANAGPSALEAQLVSASGCLWSGYQSLAAIYRQSHQQQQTNLTLTDGLVTRMLQCFAGGVPDSYTIAPHLAAASPSYQLTQRWTDAVSGIGGVSSQAHYKRHGPGTVVRMTGYIPTVRVSCNQYINASFPDNNTWLYPYLSANGMPANGYYKLPAGRLYNTSTIAAVWRVAPHGSATLTDGSAIDYFPSTFLDLQITHNGTFEPFGAAYTCSIDARWIRRDTVGTQFNYDDPSSYFVFGEDEYGNENTFPYADESIPAHGAVKMTLDWLNNLTPPLDDQNNGYTTMSQIFEATRLDDAFTDQAPKLPFTESIIATVVADGMSRVGYLDNGGDVTLADFHKNYLDDGSGGGMYDFENVDFTDMAYYDGARLPLPRGHDTSNSTLVSWSVSISGYSYKADGVAYWLSLMVLFVHSLIAVAHTAWILSKRVSSGAWHSLVELLVLSQNSEPSRELRNTCSGIEKDKTFKKRAKICVVGVSDTAYSTGREQVQLLFDDAKHRLATSQVDVNASYGAS